MNKPFKSPFSIQNKIFKMPRIARDLTIIHPFTFSILLLLELPWRWLDSYWVSFAEIKCHRRSPTVVSYLWRGFPTLLPWQVPAEFPELSIYAWRLVYRATFFLPFLLWCPGFFKWDGLSQNKTKQNKTTWWHQFQEKWRRALLPKNI